MKIIINNENFLLDMLFDQFMEQKDKFATLTGKIENDDLIIENINVWDHYQIKQTNEGFKLLNDGFELSCKIARDNKSDFVIGLQTYPCDKATKDIDLLEGNQQLIKDLTEFYENILDNTIYIGGIVSRFGDLKFYKYNNDTNNFELVEWVISKKYGNKKRVKKL